jgi:NADH-quinone oxidoreductase subunit H
MAAFISDYVWPLVVMVAESILLLVVLLIVVAYVLLADRKIWAAVQIRRGPNVVGPWGLFQSFADLIKFVLKEPVIPAGANKGVFLLAPLVTCVLALAAWAVIPVNAGWVISNINVGILYIFAISSLGVYGVIMAGWASNSKYPFLAALRSAAQMVSYEVSIGFVIITVLLCVGSLNLSAIVEAQNSRWGLLGWYWLPLFPMLIIFFVSALAETNRPPFDLVEAESELVAGYAVEYGSTPYMMLMLGEYVAICTMCAICTILFLGGWLPPFPVVPFTWVPGIVWFVLKAGFVFFMFAMVKAFVPRYRYDQLMRLGWKVFLPISLAMVAIVAAVLQVAGWAGGGHGIVAAGLARRAVRNDRRSRDLRSGSPDRGAASAQLERCQNARAARRIRRQALGCAARNFGLRRRNSGGSGLLDRQHGWRREGLI